MKARPSWAPTFAAVSLTLGLNAATVPDDGLIPQGGEYRLTRLLRGDQVHPRAALGSSGGYLVWQDNVTDGDGSGVSAIRVGAGLSAGLEAFRVNVEGAGEQEKPDVALLEGGGAVIVWQSGNSVRARVLDADGLFTTETDIVVSSHNSTAKANPVVASLADGGALVLWGSHGQDDAAGEEAFGGYRHLQGIFAQRLDARGGRVGEEYQVNQEVRFNQRNPAVVRLASGRLVAAWVSERGQIGIVNGELTDRVEGIEIKGRLFSATGEPEEAEFHLSEPGVVAASPALSPRGDGFVAVWCQGDKEKREVGFEILSRAFSATGVPSGSPQVVNSHWYGDQFAPSVASAGGTELVVWTSIGQDGSREGVFGQFMTGAGKVGSEFRVNTTTVSQQIHPRVIATDGRAFLALWTSYVGSPGDFEVMGQRYSLTLPPAPAPTVSALSANRFSLAWPAIGGFEGVEYLVHVDGSSAPEVTTDFFWTSPAAFQPSSTHTFRLAYRLPGGAVSPLSESVRGTTWGSDDNFDGLPDDWQAAHWGTNRSQWPAPGTDSDGDGMSNRDEFLAGTSPRDPASLLKTKVTATPQGALLSWNTTPGLVYQVQESPDLGVWAPLGGARFAHGATDQIPIEHPGTARYYRVIRLR